MLSGFKIINHRFSNDSWCVEGLNPPLLYTTRLYDHPPLQPWELGKKIRRQFFFLTFAVAKVGYEGITAAKIFENYSKRNYSKVCDLFILQNIVMESEHNTKLFYKNVILF